MGMDWPPKLPNIYYADDAICIVHADCREILPLLPDKSVDLVLTDPPYGVHHKKKGEPYMAGDNINQLPFIVPLFYRLLKEDGGLFIFSSTEYLRDALFAFQTYFRMHNLIIWDKTVPIYPHHISHFKLQYEPILYGSRGLFYLKTNRCSDIIRCPIERGKNRVHPTQKPSDLVKALIQYTEDTKQIILDPFLGSGTTAYCAKKLGRKCIGIEIEEHYCDIAAKRCSQMVLPLEMKQEIALSVMSL